jgi:hypothetical protein
MDEETPGSTLRYICCAADRTYGAGAIPPGMDQDAPGARTRNPGDFGIELIGELFPTARYHWRFPANGFIAPTAFTHGLADFYASIATKNCPASVLVRLKDAVLAHSILYADVSRVPTIVYETYRPNDRPAVRIIDHDAIATADPHRFADGNWINLFIGSAGSANYGHWLVDDLPRLKAAQLLTRIDPRPIRVLIHSYGAAIDRVRMESIRLVLGAMTHIDLLAPDTPYRFDEIYYATPVSDHPVQKSPVAIDHAVRETISSALAEDRDPGDRTLLFVTRSSRHGRTLANETEIRQLVEQRGFTTVDTEEMDFGDQVRLFAGAQVVIGEMGAAMTNTVFCRPSTTLIYLAPSGWIEPFYWDLAVVRGQYYRVLFGDVTDPLILAHRSDFTVDPIALHDAIDTL